MRRNSGGMVFVVSFCCLLAGCGGGSANYVSGKVTLDGAPVTGTIHFLCGGKEASGGIGPDGTYFVAEPPKGEAVVLIKRNPGALDPPPANMPALPGSENAAASTPQAKNPPDKYADASGGLKFTVSGGKQVYDIQLTP